MVTVGLVNQKAGYPGKTLLKVKYERSLTKGTPTFKDSEKITC